MDIPQIILGLNNMVTLATEVIFVNGLDFFVSTLWRIKFTTLEYIPKHTKGKLMRSINKVIGIYNASAFNIRTDLMDQ